MKKTSSSPILTQDHDFICPITLNVCRDPVFASNSYVYERTAIIQWIEQQGTSPLTRQPLNVNDLRSEDQIKQLRQPYETNSVRYLCKNSTISLPSISMGQLEIHTNQSTSRKRYCNVKRILLTIMATILTASPLIAATVVIFVILRSNPISENI
ncbi:unnamed protein product [Rotaria sp. Silwood1]|nr:unnamed protein product [Rotaria sp. Silwood1]